MNEKSLFHTKLKFFFCNPSILTIIGLTFFGIILSTLIAVTLFRSRVHPPEGNISSFLRNLSAAQENFVKSIIVDQNNDGMGEYGLFQELWGGKCRNDKAGQKLSSLKIPDLFQVKKGINSEGFITKWDYHFQIYLPHIDKVITDHSDGVNGSQHRESIQMQRKKWIAYAWPARFGISGTCCFVVDQSGKVYVASNMTKDKKPIYYGNHGPKFNAAMNKSLGKITSLHWQPIVDNNGKNSVDGQSWVMTGS